MPKAIRYISSTVVGDLTINDPKHAEGIGISITLQEGQVVDLIEAGFSESAIQKSQLLKNAINKLHWVDVLTEDAYNSTKSIEPKSAVVTSVVSGIDEENFYDEKLREVEDKEEERNIKTAVSSSSRLTTKKLKKE